MLDLMTSLSSVDARRAAKQLNLRMVNPFDFVLDFENWFRWSWAYHSDEPFPKFTQLLGSSALLTVPSSVSRCPYCNARLTVQFEEWQENDFGSWKATQCDIQCEDEPAIDVLGAEWEEWLEGHSFMPYENWLPAQEKVLTWVNHNYRFKL